MGEGARDVSILRRRAERIAQRRAQATPQETVASVLVVIVSGAYIGIRRDAIDNVVPVPTATRLPGTPDSISGIAQIKGEVIAIVDLAHYLELGRTGSPRRLVVVALHPGKLGLLVDELVGFRDITTAELAGTMLAQGEPSSRPIQAMTKDLVSILDLDRLVRSDRVRVVRSTVAGSSHGEKEEAAP